MNKTNITVEHHNTWTLTKHVAGSINKAASNIDAKIYGTKTNVVVIEEPTPPPPAPETPIWDIICVIGGAIIVVGIFIAYITGKVKGRNIIGL